MPDLWKLSASEAHEQFVRGDLTVEAYAKSLLQHIEACDPTIHAWAYLDQDRLLREARRLDAIPADQRGPLHGFAIAVKDVILTKDMPTAYNSPIFKDHPVQNVDANPIITLRAAGALLVGKTHTTEFAASMDGPVTRNPHNADRTPGGSSSGSGAAVGGYEVPMALGTQTMGSVIRPGSYNGCYAYKTTWGAISREGLCMSSATFDTFGMFSRSVDDFEALADAFRLADDEPSTAKPFELSGARIGFCKTHPWVTKATPALEAAWAKARTLLTERGATIVDVDLPEDFVHFPEYHRAICRGEGVSSFMGQYTLSKDKLHHGLVDYFAEPLPHKELLHAYDSCARLRSIFDDIARKYDVIVTPSAPDEAPSGFHTGDGAFCLTWSTLHVPVVNVPGFSGTTGLPLGMSLVGPRYGDRKLLRVAKVIGEVFEKEGGWHPKIIS